jgi:hypothetical protein
LWGIPSNVGQALAMKNSLLIASYLVEIPITYYNYQAPPKHRNLQFCTKVNMNSLDLSISKEIDSKYTPTRQKCQWTNMSKSIFAKFAIHTRLLVPTERHSKVRNNYIVNLNVLN